MPQRRVQCLRSARSSHRPLWCPERVLLSSRPEDLGEGVRQMIWSGLYLIGTTGAGGPMMIRGAERTLNMMQTGG